MTHRTGMQGNQAAGGADGEPARPDRGVFAALGRMVTRHPWRVIAGWLIVAVAVIATAPALPTTTNEASFLPSSYESIKAQNLQDQAFPEAGKVDAAAAIIVFARSDGGRLTPADQAKVASVASTLNDKHIPNILSVTAGPVSPNGLVQTASVAMSNDLVNGSGTQAADAIKVLRADIKPLMNGAGLYQGVTGAAASQLDSQQSGNKAEQIVLFATLVLILVLLLVIFRSPIIAFLPIITIGVVSAGRPRADRLARTTRCTSSRQLRSPHPHRRAVRHRHRLHPVPDVPLPGDGCAPATTPKQAMVDRGRPGRRGDRLGRRRGDHRVPRPAAVHAGHVPVARPGAGHRRRGHPDRRPHSDPRHRVTLLGTRVFWPSKAWQREPTGARFAAIGGALGRHPA